MDTVSSNQRLGKAKGRRGFTGIHSLGTADGNGVEEKAGHRRPIFTDERPESSCGDRARMFFRVVEASDIDGETRITVAFPSEDKSLKVIFQFLESASEFAHIFRYKSEAILNSQKRVEEWDKDKEKNIALRKEVYAYYLSLKPMRTSDRFHNIQEYLRGKGLSYTYSQVDAMIAVAYQERRKEKELRKAPKIIEGANAGGLGQKSRLAHIGPYLANRKSGERKRAI